MANTLDPLVAYFLVPLVLLPHMLLDCMAKDVIWGSIVSYNSSKL
jgi:hypothetical protein